MRRILVLFILVSMIVTSLEAQKKKKKSKDDDAPKKTEYQKLTESKNKIGEGVYTVYKKDSKYYLEVPASYEGRDFLIVPRIARFANGMKFGGAGMSPKPEYVITWDRLDNKLLLRAKSFNNVASEELPIAQSVKYNNFEPIIHAFDIQAFSQDSSSYVVEIDDFFNSDADIFSPLSDGDRSRFEIKGLDKDRSMISSIKVFPDNIEIRHILTYNGDELPSNSNTGALSVEMNESIVLLPEEPMQPRYGDPRVGFFGSEIVDYGSDEQRAATKTIIRRWRLEPQDWEAYNRGELVEPVKPIVYYIDPATPEKFRPYFKQGIEDWQSAFEKIGFKNAIVAKDAPSSEEDPDWSPEDVRYSVARYITTEIVNAQGPHTHDPRSGEIIESDILWYHNVISWLRALSQIQTGAVNERARAAQLAEEDLGLMVRYVMAHEVGHTLGFPHNFAASAAYPVDSLRSPSFTQKWGITSSIMEYARANYVAQPGDGDVHLFNNKIGPYDDWAIMYGYKPIPEASSAEEELPILMKWVNERVGDPKYRYGRQTSGTYHPDPSAQSEDLGDNSMKASAYGIANLKRIIPNIIEWNKVENGEWTPLEEAWSNVMGQWNNYLKHVTHNIGGVYYNPTKNGQGRQYEYVPEERQKEAMNFLLTEFYIQPDYLLNEDILRRLQNGGVVNRIQSAQETSLRRLLDENKMARLIEFELFHGDDAYTLNEMMTDLRRGIWSELRSGSGTSIIRRNLQKSYLARMEHFMDDDYEAPRMGGWNSFGSTSIDAINTDIKSNIVGQLTVLKEEIDRALTRVRDTETRYHLLDCKQRVEKMLKV